MAQVGPAPSPNFYLYLEQLRNRIASDSLYTWKGKQSHEKTGYYFQWGKWVFVKTVSPSLKSSRGPVINSIIEEND